MKRKILVLVIISISFVFSYRTAQAFNLNVREGKVRLIIPPGGTKAGSIPLENTSDKPIFVTVHMEDWAYISSSDGSKKFSPAGTLANSCANWVKFSPAKLSIPPYGKGMVSYMVNVPQDATGGYYSVLFFESIMSNAANDQGVNVDVALSIGTLFYVEPQGTIRREVALRNLTLEKNAEKSSFNLSLEMENTGNIDATASGTFHIMDKKGMVYTRGEFNKVYTLPGDKAQLLSEWKEALSKGIYDLILTIDIGKALEEAKLGRGPIIVKEAKIEVGPSGEILQVGEMK